MSPIDARVLRLVESSVAAYFAAAEGVVLAGSSASGTCAPTSHLDLLLVGPDQMFDGHRTSLAAA